MPETWIILSEGFCQRRPHFWFPAIALRRKERVACFTSCFERVTCDRHRNTGWSGIIYLAMISFYACPEVASFSPATGDSKWNPASWRGSQVTIPMLTGPINRIPGSCFGSGSMVGLWRRHATYYRYRAYRCFQEFRWRICGKNFSEFLN